MKKTFIIKILSIIIIAITSLSHVCAQPLHDTTQAEAYCVKGDKILNHYEKLTDKTDSAKYLKAAKYYYYQALRVDISNQNALVGMAKISLYQGNTRDAKNALMVALNVDERNPKVNYYLGEAFFKEAEYFQAIDFFSFAYSYGFQNDYRTNLRLGICYEKLNDIEKAKFHYNTAIKTNPSDTEAKQRLSELHATDAEYKDVLKQQTYDEPIDKKDLEKLNLPNL